MDPYVAEIRIVGFNFAPTGWTFCNGAVLPINQNMALFSILGTNYGGNGTSTYGIPNLQNSVAIGQGQGPGLSFYAVGQYGGQASVTLTNSQLPIHTHAVNAIGAAGAAPAPSNTEVWAGAPAGGGKTPAPTPYYSTSPNNGSMNASAIGIVGGGQPHNNMSPYQALNFIIALTGIYPTHS